MNNGLRGFPVRDKPKIAGVVLRAPFQTAPPLQTSPWCDLFEDSPRIDTEGRRHIGALRWVERNGNFAQAMIPRGGTLYATGNAAGNQFRGFAMTAPPSSFCIGCTVAIAEQGAVNNGDAGVGMWTVDSTSGRSECIILNNIRSLYGFRFNSDTSFNSVVYNVNVGNTVTGVVMRVIRNGSTLTYQYALQIFGEPPVWITAMTHAETTFLTNGVLLIGLVAAGSNGNYGHRISSWRRYW